MGCRIGGGGGEMDVARVKPSTTIGGSVPAHEATGMHLFQKYDQVHFQLWDRITIKIKLRLRGVRCGKNLNAYI